MCGCGTEAESDSACVFAMHTVSLRQLFDSVDSVAGSSLLSLLKFVNFCRKMIELHLLKVVAVLKLGCRWGRVCAHGSSPGLLKFVIISYTVTLMLIVQCSGKCLTRGRVCARVSALLWTVTDFYPATLL